MSPSLVLHAIFFFIFIFARYKFFTRLPRRLRRLDGGVLHWLIMNNVWTLLVEYFILGFTRAINEIDKQKV